MKVCPYVEVHCAVEDADGDNIQCRWAQRMRGECDDLCSVLLPAVLDESTVSVLVKKFNFPQYLGGLSKVLVEKLTSL